MKLLKSVIALTLSALVHNSAIARESVDMRSLPILRADNSLHFVVPTKVNGKSTYVILDSGSGGNVTLSTEYAKSLNLKVTQSGSSKDIKGETANYTAMIKEIAVANILKIRNSDTRLRDFSRLKSIKVKGKDNSIMGLVGSPFLDQVNAVFIAKGPKLLMPKSGTKPDGYARALQGQGYERLQLKKGKHKYPVVTVKIKGQDYDFLVDTGSAINILLKDVAKELKLPLKDSTNTASGPSGGKIALKVTTVDKIILGNRALLPNTEFYVLPQTGQKSVSDGKYGGIIGVNTLLRWNMQLDFGSYSLLMPAAK